MNVIVIEQKEFEGLMNRIESIEGLLKRVTGHMDENEAGLMNQTEAAKLLQITPQTLISYRKAGMIDCIWKGSKPYYTKKILNDFKK